VRLLGGDLVFIRESAEDLFPADPMPLGNSITSLTCPFR
jgi:hypothetical protein